MNWDQVRSRWPQLRGSAQEQWGRLSDDDLDIIDGHRERLISRLEVRYGMPHAQAEWAIEEWLQPLRSMS